MTSAFCLPLHFNGVVGTAETLSLFKRANRYQTTHVFSTMSHSGVKLFGFSYVFAIEIIVTFMCI